jgi:hypothetical protein
MNTFSKSIAKSFAVLGTVSSLAFLTSSSTALAQTQVTVTNGPSMAIPVTGTINTNPAPQVLHPYQQEGFVSDSSTCAPQCIISFPVVPAGSRLVVTNVSAQVGASNDSFVIEGNGVAYFVPKAYPTASDLNAPVTVYFEPGSTPTARFFIPNATEHTSLIVSFVGYYVPTQ